MKRASRWLSGLAGLVWFCCGCGAPEQPAARAGEPNRVVIGVRGDAKTFNIYTATNAFAQDVIDLLYMRLAVERDDFTEGPPSFEPGLLRQWELSADGLQLHAELDPAARWSDGEPVTAGDVVFSYRAATDPGVAWVGADTKDSIAGIERGDDPARLTFRFSSAYPYALADAFEGNIVPEHAFASVPFASWPTTTFREAPAANGPFLLARYESNQLIELERNPGYLRAPLPRLDSVVFRILPDADTRLNELVAGTLDLVADVPADQVERIEAAGRHRVVRVPDLSYAFICWNTAKPQFADATVRRALTLAIDRAAIIEGLLPRTGRPSFSPIPSILWAHHDALEPLPYDPAEARRLLEAAGWKDRDGDGWLDRDGVPFRFDLETNQESRLRSDVAEAVTEQLRRLGIRAIPRTFEFAAAIDRRERHDFDAFVSSWRESTKVDLRSVLHSSAIEDGYNYGSYADAELDRLIDRARIERDFTSARELWRRAQERIQRDQPYTFLFERDRLHAVHRDLEGFRPGPRSPYAGLELWQWQDRAPR